MKLFKASAEKAEDDYRKAYEKGVRLGPSQWDNAVTLFSSASANYNEAGMTFESQKCIALAWIFRSAIAKTDPNNWRNCSVAANTIGSTQLDIGFAANSTDIARQAALLWEEESVMNGLDVTNRTNVERLKSVAQKYLELVGSNPVLWKLMGQQVDFEKSGFYYLAMASYVEALVYVRIDPARAVSLSSEAQTHLELATIDTHDIKSGLKALSENVAKTAKCWFCDREVQGSSYNFIVVKSMLSEYMRAKFQVESVASLGPGGNTVVACLGCYSAVNNLADAIARRYYDQMMVQLRTVTQQLESRIVALENRLRMVQASQN